MGYDVNNAYRSGATGAEILRCAQDDSQALRMTARTPLTSSHGKFYFQMSSGSKSQQREPDTSYLQAGK